MEKIIFNKFNSDGKQYHNSELIIKILSESPCPLPLNFLASLTKLKHTQVARICRKLYKERTIDKSTVTKAVFYKIKKSDEK